MRAHSCVPYISEVERTVFPSSSTNSSVRQAGRPPFSEACDPSSQYAKLTSGTYTNQDAHGQDIGWNYSDIFPAPRPTVTRLSYSTIVQPNYTYFSSRQHPRPTVVQAMVMKQHPPRRYQQNARISAKYLSTESVFEVLHVRAVPSREETVSMMAVSAPPERFVKQTRKITSAIVV